MPEPGTEQYVAWVASMIDHSLVRPELTVDQVREGCELALAHQVASVFVRPSDVPLAARMLVGGPVTLGTVAGFPHGSSSTAAKVAEVSRALAEGAGEIDMVLNIGLLRSGADAEVGADIEAVVRAAGPAPVKVILENAYLDDAQKVRGCQLAERAGAAFVKTSTGFAPGGATLADVRLMRRSVSPAVAVKAAGGVRTLPLLLEYVAAGAIRFGATATSSILAAAAGATPTVEPPAGY